MKRAKLKTLTLSDGRVLLPGETFQVSNTVNLANAAGSVTQVTTFLFQWDGEKLVLGVIS